MPPSAHASASSRILKNIVDVMVIVPVAAFVIIAVLVATASMAENLRFAKATGQILSLVGAARDFAGREQSFAAQPGEDVLTTLTHAGLIADIVEAGPVARLINPWRNDVVATVSAPYEMRLETDVPPRACRRLGLFFAGRTKDLGLHIMEAREGMNGIWRRFYDSGGQETANESMIEAACGQQDTARLALAFKLKG